MGQCHIADFDPCMMEKEHMLSQLTIPLYYGIELSDIKEKEGNAEDAISTFDNYISLYNHQVSMYILSHEYNYRIFLSVKINYYPFLRQPESEGQAKWSHRRLSSLSPCMHSVHNYTWSNSL